ncbi:MAG TPA: alpha/beta hydrolase [Amnibacterium sp.]|uniref:alpha/beta hydrolase n=1 Tax=Amnibacterium sp. TaxID=1872496 RepID=UPI002F938D38
MRRARAALAALAVASALLLSGCSGFPLPTVTSTPAPVTAVAAPLRPYYGQRLVWKDCGNGFRCTTAVAPLDWKDPSGPRIHLALTQHPASGHRIGTLFMNPGGPGVSGVDFLQGSASAFFDQSLLDSYDIVAWDPRGVGHSTPAVDCYGTKQLDGFLFDDPNLPDGSAALARHVKATDTAFGAACKAKTGPLLAHVDTESTVQDLDMLRGDVGSPRLDYFGFSYGTLIGALYADRYPTRVGRMALDGAVDPANTAFDENLANTKAFGAALQTYLAHCIATAGCPFDRMTVDEATATIATLLVRLRESPLRAKDGRKVNSAVLRTAIDAALYDERDWPALTQALAQVLKGDPTTTLELADSYTDRTAHGYADNLFEALYAVDCLDKPVETDPAVLAEEGRQLTAADPLRAADTGESLGDQVCAHWPVKPTAVQHRVHATGSPPILVLGTTGDPATPFSWAQSLASQLQHGVLIGWRGQGHTAYRNHVPCVNQRVDAFFTAGTVPSPVMCG